METGLCEAGEYVGTGEVADGIGAGAWAGSWAEGTGWAAGVAESEIAGMAVVYLFGISYFYIASNYIVDAPITLWLALWYCGILQVVPDFLLCLAAAFIGIRCRKAGLWL